MRNVQHKIKQIMQISDRNEREIKLRKLAQEYGCSLSSTYTSDGTKHMEDEIIRRIQEADRSIRESRLWWIAAISAVAAVFSAMAAWLAVYFSSRPGS